MRPRVKWRDNWSELPFKSLLASTLPLPIPGEDREDTDREDAVSVHLMRAGPGRLSPLRGVPAVPGQAVPVAFCAECREG